MKKIGIINTSTSCLDYLDHGHYLKTARMQLVMGGKSYVDYVDIQAKEFFDKIENNKELMPSTSTPNSVEFEELIKEYEEEGYDEVLILTISSKLSACFSIAKSVADEYEGNMKVQTYDTKSAAFIEGYLVLKALELSEKGMSLDDIIPRLDKIRDNGHVYFVVDSLRLFIKNGRLSNASGFVGTALKIKPLLHVDDEGYIHNVAKVRTSKKAINAMIEKFLLEVKELDDFAVLLLTSNNPEMEKYVEDRIKENYPDVEFSSTPLTPVVGCHTGERIVGLGYYAK